VGTNFELARKFAVAGRGGEDIIEGGLGGGELVNVDVAAIGITHDNVGVIGSEFLEDGQQKWSIHQTELQRDVNTVRRVVGSKEVRGRQRQRRRRRRKASWSAVVT
jgi:hypothetical protein